MNIKLAWFKSNINFKLVYKDDQERASGQLFVIPKMGWVEWVVTLVGYVHQPFTALNHPDSNLKHSIDTSQFTFLRVVDLGGRERE